MNRNELHLIIHCCRVHGVSYVLYINPKTIQLSYSEPVPFPESNSYPQQLEAPELANPRECVLDGEEKGDLESLNKRAVTALYDAFNSKDVNVVHLLLAPYLEWWFHGPPTHQHLNRLLTGALPYDSSFVFAPLSIVAFGSMVVAEGYDEGLSVSWVHAWTVTDGIITQVREYYNTSVTVTRLASPENTSSLGSCQSVWESKLSDNKSVPGLVLAL